MKTIKYPNNDFHCHLALSLAQTINNERLKISKKYAKKLF